MSFLQNRQSDATAARVIHVDGREHRIISRGRWLTTALIFDEVWSEAPPVTNPAQFVQIALDAGVQADLFSFAQRLPDTSPYFDFHYEWENVAVAPCSDFRAWWDSLPQESRKNVRKAQKRGVTLRPVAFDDALVHGIKAIYDEVPLRQGRRFWHYGKDFETVRRENSSYLDRSHFIGAFLGEQLVGFVKIVRVDATARIMQILARAAHHDKHVMNALLATTMEHCSRIGATHLIYGQYVYGNKRNSSVTEFKRRNGFVEVLLPRYYIPLTRKGQLALGAQLHRKISDILPEQVTNLFLATRLFAYERLGLQPAALPGAPQRS